jgi:hypothetical protein
MFAAYVCSLEGIPASAAVAEFLSEILPLGVGIGAAAARQRV